VHETHIALEQSKLDPTASVFPLLSQGDHPVLQILCWYFHPCETERAVKELLRERQTAEGQDGAATMGTEQWLETWLVVLSTLVNLEEDAVL
jgi:ubiquitin-like-conjugating enzyme ATG10